MGPVPAAPEPAPTSPLRARLEAMAARHAASGPPPDPEPAGPPPTDEEALANVLEGLPGAVVQETVHPNRP